MGSPQNVAVTCTSNDKVVGIMRYTGSYRTFAQSEALDQTEAHTSAGMVPFDDN